MFTLTVITLFTLIAMLGYFRWERKEKVARFLRLTVPMVRKVYPRLICEQIASVQPLTYIDIRKLPDPMSFREWIFIKEGRVVKKVEK